MTQGTPYLFALVPPCREVRSGTRLSRRRQWASAFFEPFSLGAFGLLGRPPHRLRTALSEGGKSGVRGHRDVEFDGRP